MELIISQNWLITLTDWLLSWKLGLKMIDNKKTEFEVKYKQSSQRNTIKSMETNINSLCFYLRLLLTFCAFPTFFSSLLIHHFCYFMFGLSLLMHGIHNRTYHQTVKTEVFHKGRAWCLYFFDAHGYVINRCGILVFHSLFFTMFWSTCSLDFQLAYLDPDCLILIWYGSHVLSYSSKPGNQLIDVLYYQRE